jgi:hypothetical protein
MRVLRFHLARRVAAHPGQPHTRRNAAGLSSTHRAFGRRPNCPNSPSGRFPQRRQHPHLNTNLAPVLFVLSQRKGRNCETVSVAQVHSPKASPHSGGQFVVDFAAESKVQGNAVLCARAHTAQDCAATLATCSPIHRCSQQSALIPRRCLPHVAYSKPKMTSRDERSIADRTRGARETIRAAKRHGQHLASPMQGRGTRNLASTMTEKTARKRATIAQLHLQ